MAIGEWTENGLGGYWLADNRTPAAAIVWFSDGIGRWLWRIPDQDAGGADTLAGAKADAERALKRLGG